MHVWVSDRPLVIVAPSEAEAKQEHAKEAATSGHRYPWMHEVPRVWRQLDDDEELTIRDPEPVTKTAGTWARLKGQGFLAVFGPLPDTSEAVFFGPGLLTEKFYELN